MIRTLLVMPFPLSAIYSSTKVHEKMVRIAVFCFFWYKVRIAVYQQYLRFFFLFFFFPPTQGDSDMKKAHALVRGGPHKQKREPHTHGKSSLSLDTWLRRGVTNKRWNPLFYLIFEVRTFIIKLPTF